MFNFRLFHPLQNFYKKEGKCIKFIKLFKFRNNNSKNNKKHLKVFKKILEKEIYKFKYIWLIFVNFYNKMMQKEKRHNKDSNKNKRYTTRNKNKYKNYSNRFLILIKSNKNLIEKLDHCVNINNIYKRCDLLIMTNIHKCQIYYLVIRH